MKTVGEGKNAAWPIRRFLRCIVVILLLSGAMMVAMPQPAHAVDDGCGNGSSEVGFSLWNTILSAAKWVKEHAGYLSFLNGILDIIEFFTDKFGLLREGHGNGDGVQVAAIGGEQMIEEHLTQASVDSEYANVPLDAKVRHFMDRSGASAAEQFLCNLILARQVLPVMTEFARIVSYNVSTGILRRYRAKTSDGNGPQFIGDAGQIRRGAYGQNRAKTGDPIDGAGEDEVDDPSLRTTGFASADTSVTTLSFERVLSIPPVKDVTRTVDGVAQTVKDFVPDPENRNYDAQRLWLVARDFCYNMAGPRPSPPRDEEMDTPEGKTKFARFITCQARHSQAVKRCADRLGKITRPDCSNEDFKAFCDASIEACDAARTAGLQLSPAYNDCSNGLSLYQAEYLSVQLCGSNRRLQADINAGTRGEAGVGTLLLCRIMQANWEKQIRDEEQALIRSVTALAEGGACWNDTGR